MSKKFWGALTSLFFDTRRTLDRATSGLEPDDKALTTLVVLIFFTFGMLKQAIADLQVGKKIWTVITVFLFFSWGTCAWATGKSVMDSELAFALNITTYAVSIAAVPLKDRIRSNNTTFLVTGSAVALIGMLMMTQPNLVPIGYLIVGLMRIVLIPCNLAFLAANLGSVLGTTLSAAAYAGADVVFGPVITAVFARNLGWLGPVIGAVFVVASIVTTLLSRTDRKVKEPAKPHTLDTLGEAAITTGYIYLAFGVLGLLLYNLAEMRGARAGGASLVGLLQLGAVLGLFFSFSRVRSRSRLWITVQFCGALCIVAGFRLDINALIYLGLIAQGVGFSVLERDAEVKYLEGFANRPSGSVAIQIIDASYRIATGTGELLATFVPPHLALWLLPIFPVVHAILLETSLKRAVGKRLTVVSNKEPKKKPKQEQSDTK